MIKRGFWVSILWEYIWKLPVLIWYLCCCWLNWSSSEIHIQAEQTCVTSFIEYHTKQSQCWNKNAHHIWPCYTAAQLNINSSQISEHVALAQTGCANKEDEDGMKLLWISVLLPHFNHVFISVLFSSSMSTMRFSICFTLMNLNTKTTCVLFCLNMQLQFEVPILLTESYFHDDNYYY